MSGSPGRPGGGIRPGRAGRRGTDLSGGPAGRRAAGRVPARVLGALLALPLPALATPRLVTGEAAAPVAARLGAAASLGPAEVAPAGVGYLLRLPQAHRGVPVLGGEVTVRIDDKGRAVHVARDLLTDEQLRAIDVAPRIDGAAARRAVEALGRGAAGAPVLQVDLEERRLVWVVPSFDLGRLEHALYLVDARDGRLLRRIERLWFFDRFRVFRPNPALDPAGADAALPGGAMFSPLPGSERPLSGRLLRAQNCVDEGTAREVPGLGGAAHLCVPRQTALSDAEGDYHGLRPLVNGEDGRCPTSRDANPNAFAEAHMYWHAAAIYERFRRLYAGLGRPDFRLRVSTGADPRPLAMVVNLCLPDFSHLSDVTRPLQPLENAFFSPGGLGGFNEILTGQDADALGFGMGRRANFALDGDVIYHEFTHAVLWSRGRLTSALVEDEHGLSTDPGALNEALADYFSAALSGDPEIGEYAGRNFSSAGGGLRSLDNDERCAEQRTGQIHEDSKAFSGALWQARRAVAGAPGEGGPAAGRRDLFDQAVLAALDGAGARPSMTDMAKLVLEEIELRPQLGAGAAQQAERAFAAHGVLPRCDRVIRGAAPKPLLCLNGVEGRGGRKLMAGHVQWRIEVPGTADTLRVRLEAQPGTCAGGSGMAPPAAQLKLAVRAADEPLTWDRDEGSQDQLVDLKRTGTVWEGQVAVNQGVHHVMLVNAGGSAIGRSIVFSMSCAAAAGCREPAPPAPPAGCGCRVGASPAPASGLGLLLLAALLRRRRR